MTPSAGQNNFPSQDAEPMHGNGGYARPMFTEAEQRIVAKGIEVATKAAEIERAEYQVKLQQQATAQSWERTQQRENHSKRMLQESQQVQHELENIKAAVAAEVQVVQVQVAAERDSITQRQQAVEADRQRTFEIQAEVERQVAIKQRELAEKEMKINQENRELAKERSMLEQTTRKAKEMAQALVETEKQRRIAAETERAVLQGKLGLLTYQLQQKPEVFKMDVDDNPVEVPTGDSTRQAEQDHLLAMSLAEETEQQAAYADWSKRGTVAVTTSTSSGNQRVLGIDKEEITRKTLGRSDVLLRGTVAVTPFV